MPLFRNTSVWYLGISAYWFATSLKWFVLLVIVLPFQVGESVPGGTENSAWGRVVAIGAAEAMIGPALFGYLSDRCCSRWGRRRPFIAIGAALTALALLFLSGADRLWMFILGYLCLQISDDIATGPYAALIPDLVPEENRGRASGVMSLLQLAAQVVGAAVAVVGLFLKSYLLIYATIAAVNIICALIVLVMMRERGAAALPNAVRGPETLSAPGADRRLGARIRRGYRNWIAPWESPDFRWVWLTRFLVALGFYLLTFYAPHYLKDSVRVFPLFGFHLQDAKLAAVTVAVVLSLTGAVGALYAGRQADRIGRKRVIIWSGWLMFSVLAPFAFFPVFPLIVLLAGIFGFGYGAYLSGSWALAADILPSAEDAAKDMGIWQASVATPQIVAGLVGVLVDLGNRQRLGAGYTVAFLFASVAFLAGATLVKRVRGST